VSLAVSDHAAELASAAWLTARWWSRPVADVTGEWDQAWPDAPAAAVAVGLEPRIVVELEEAFRAADGDALLDEYERLFVGPGRVPCQPYEALWRGDQPRREQGMLMGKASTEVLAVYRSLDLVVSAEAHELPDHIAIEWEALSYAFEVGSDEAASSLLEKHLAVWIPTFCVAVAAETEQPFYRGLAALTPLWVSGLIAASSG
jgi:TorA maturation chaperone TorD